MSNKKNQKGGDIENLNDAKEKILKRFDSWHDFGHPHSNRFAPGGLEKNEKKIALSPGKAPPSVFLPDAMNPKNKLVLSMNNNRLYRANKKNEDGTVKKYQYQNDNCSTKVRMRSVSYERLATAALDSCALENAWTKDNMLTWDQIYDRDSSIWDGASKRWKDTASFNYSDILIIADGDEITKSYGSTLRKPTAENQKRRNIVGNFIINYMFPGYQGNEPVAITFDAASGKVTKVFSGMGQVKALITPQNISDSATTQLDPFSAFKEFGHKRTEFLFPEENQQSWRAKSQYYSNDWCEIEYENVDFNTNSPNGFRIKINWNRKISDGEKRGTDPEFIFSIDYATLGYSNPKNKSGSAASGPSAPYLRGLIETIINRGKEALIILQNDTSFQPDSSTIIPLYTMVKTIYDSLTEPPISDSDEDAKRKITGLLLDLKRAGDYEQANAAQWAQKFDPTLKVILSTGDVLCSTYSRSMKQPCILQGIGSSSGQGADAIALFRFPAASSAASLPPAYEKVTAFFDSIEESNRKMDDPSRSARKADNATNVIDVLKGEFQKLIRNGQLKSNIPPFNQKNPNLSTNQQLQQQMTDEAINICTILLKLKYRQMKTSISPPQDDEDSMEAKQTIDGNPQTVETIKSSINLLMNKKQEILKQIRNDWPSIVASSTSPLASSESDENSNWAWNKFETILPRDERGLQIDIKPIKDFMDLQTLVEEGNPIVDKIASKKIEPAEITQFFSQTDTTTDTPYFPLYKTPESSVQKKVNGFLKSIGLDIGLFFKVFSNFMKFLSAIPSNLAKVQKYLDKYEKQSLSVLGKQYNDKFGANEIFEAIANFIPYCLSYFDSIRKNAVDQTESIPDERRRGRKIEALVKKSLKKKSAYEPFDDLKLELQLQSFAVSIVQALSELNESINSYFQHDINTYEIMESESRRKRDESSDPLQRKSKRAKSSAPSESSATAYASLQSSAPFSDATSYASSPRTTKRKRGAGKKIKQKGGVLNYEEVNKTALELFQNISSRCNGFITDGINMNFTTNVENPDDCDGLRIIKYQIYSILFNTYESLNRFYNATTSYVDKSNNEVISQPSWQDLAATLLSLSQQISAKNENCYNTFIEKPTTRSIQPQIDYIKNLFKWIEEAAVAIKQSADNDNFAGVRTSPRFTPTNCGTGTSGLSTACRKLNELWSQLDSTLSISSSQLDLPIATAGLNALIGFINIFFESDYIVNLQKEFYEQTLISCMYSNEKLDNYFDGDEDEEERMSNIKEFEDDILDMWNDALYEDLDLDETPNIWNWEDKNGYTIITFLETNNQKENSVISLINFITEMLSKGNFIYTLACMYNTILLNNNTFNPYVSVASKHIHNPLAIELWSGKPNTGLPYCKEKSQLSFYNSDSLMSLLNKIKVERYEIFGGNQGFDNAVKREIDSPEIYVVETIAEHQGNKQCVFLLVPFPPRNGQQASSFPCNIQPCNQGSSYQAPTDVPMPDFDDDDDLGGGGRRRRIKKKNRKKKTRRRKKRKYKTLRRRKKYRKHTLKRKKRKRKTRFKK